MAKSVENLARGHLVMIVAHRAMVRDLGQITESAQALMEKPDPDRATALCDYAERFVELVEHHHEGEDEVLWPMLRELGAPADSLDLMTAEHQELHAILGDLKELISRARGESDRFGELAEAATKVREVLRTHTADEERELAGPLKPVLGMAQWKRFERSMVRSAPRWTLGFMPPWLASAATDDERGKLPAAPVAKLMRGKLERQRKAAFGEFA